MNLRTILACAAAAGLGVTEPVSVTGIQSLASRLFHQHDSQFDFQLTQDNENWSRWNIPKNDNYTVSSNNGRIRIEGTSLSALARG